MPNIDYAEIQKRKSETPAQSAARLREENRQWREELNRKNAQVYKSPLDLANALQRKHPEDIVRGFKALGYNDDDINKQFDFHRQNLIDPDFPREITDDQVYDYIRDHLENNGILPKRR